MNQFNFEPSNNFRVDLNQDFTAVLVWMPAIISLY